MYILFFILFSIIVYYRILNIVSWAHEASLTNPFEVFSADIYGVAQSWTRLK